MNWKKVNKKERQKKKSLKRGNNDNFLVENSIRMKKEPTQAENLFKTILIENHIAFKEQVPFYDKKHKYIFDFLIGDKWVVEIDGGYHNTEMQKEKDSQRDNVIRNLNFKVKRFTNEDIINYSPKLKNWINGISLFYTVKNNSLP